MRIQKYKNYLHFGLSLVLFIVILGYATLIFLGSNGYFPSNGIEKVEVSLPLIDWQKYSSLSKQYEDGILVPVPDSTD